MRVGVTEMVLLLVLALILFGGKKIAGLGGALGKSIRDFRQEVQGTPNAPSSEKAIKETSSSSV